MIYQFDIYSIQLCKNLFPFFNWVVLLPNISNVTLSSKSSLSSKLAGFSKAADGGGRK